MRDDLITAGGDPAATLEKENAAPFALDLPCAGAMLARRPRALADTAATHESLPAHDGAERMARRLHALALGNKRLLERAIAVKEGSLASLLQQL